MILVFGFGIDLYNPSKCLGSRLCISKPGANPGDVLYGSGDPSGALKVHRAGLPSAVLDVTVRKTIDGHGEFKRPEILVQLEITVVTLSLSLSLSRSNLIPIFGSMRCSFP